MTRTSQEQESQTGYRWECPFCGQSRTNTTGGETGQRRAVGALRSHIIASTGERHGPQNECPATETVDLVEHVVLTDLA